MRKNFIRVTEVTKEQHTVPCAAIVMAHDERHLRRKVLTLQSGERVLVDFPAARSLSHQDRLVLEDGRQVEVVAAEEPLLEVRSAPGQALAVLAWHLGNRHLPAQIEDDHILIQRDHVIQDMLVKLGAAVCEVVARFTPVRGAYHAHGHQYEHNHGGGDNQIHPHA
jgi:urease accessory protein